MKRAQHVGRTQRGSHIITTCACRPGLQSLSRPRDEHRRHAANTLAFASCVAAATAAVKDDRPIGPRAFNTSPARSRFYPRPLRSRPFRCPRPFQTLVGAKSFSGANKLSILSWRPGGAELGAARANTAPTLRAAYRCRSRAPRCRLASITMCYMIVCVKSEGRCSFIRGFSYGGVVRCARPLPMRSNLPQTESVRVRPPGPPNPDPAQ
jgi:hypothetical protein